MDGRTSEGSEGLPTPFSGFIIIRPDGDVYHRGYRTGREAQEVVEQIKSESGERCTVSKVVFE